MLQVIFFIFFIFQEVVMHLSWYNYIETTIILLRIYDPDSY
jgi:hypothetical protein